MSGADDQQPSKSGLLATDRVGVPTPPAGTRPLASSVATVAHIVGMTVYCLLGAFQFSPVLRGRHRWHRTAGRLLIPFGFVTALGAAWLAVFCNGPPNQLPLAMVRLFVASAMILVLVLGTAAIIRRDILARGDWMTRALITVLAAEALTRRQTARRRIAAPCKVALVS